MEYAKWIVACAVGLLFSACSNTLEVKRISNDDNQVRRGVPYNLQYTRYKVTVTRGIASCSKVVMQNGKQITIPDVAAFVKAEVQSETVDDGDHMYLIDTDSLASATSVSNLMVTLEQGRRLVGFNAQSDDQTAEVITSVASGIGKLALSSIAPLPVGVPAAPALGEVPSIPVANPVIRCLGPIERAVQNVARLQPLIEQSTKAIDGLKEKITGLQLDLRELQDVTVECKHGANAGQLKCLKEKELQDALRKREQKKSELEKDQKSLAISYALISYEQTYRWPEDSRTIESVEAQGIPDAQLAKWVEDSTAMVDEVAEYQNSVESFKGQFNVYFKINKSGSYGVNDLSTYDGETFSDNQDLVKAEGIRYRIPAGGYFLVCKQRDCKRDGQGVIVEKVGDVLQLGHIFYIPFESGAFSNREMALAFDERGLPKTVSVTQKEASATNLAGSFESVAEQVADYRKAKLVAETPKSELQKLKEHVELLQTQKALVDAEQALNPSEYTKILTDLQLKTQLAQAEKAYLDAVSALDKNSEIETNTQAAAVINTEASLILARIARLKAEIELRELIEQTSN
ncbi:MAG: hypothetical protein ABW084_11485 [Candidatus Thiodiazotropha sp.]